VGALGIAFGCWAAGTCGGLLLGRRAAGVLCGTGGAISGAAAVGWAGTRALAAPLPQIWRATWSVPAGVLALRLDPLAAVFLLPLAAVGGLCAVYGVAYLRRHAHGRPIGPSLAAYNLLLAGMTLVVAANDVVLLVVAWELMTLSSWALVVADHEDPAVRAAGLQYLIAAHIATAALVLLALFLETGAAVPPGLLFSLALIGFGTKAGIVPLHVWLPDAHPAAPSHVSALMSAVMITMGFYGLARFIPLFGPPALWWGYLLIVLGVIGAAGGVAFAIAQRDVKRVLAYSTVENAGLVTLAMGLGLLATALGQPVLAGLAWTAALLHLWNHALAKALLFLGFGAIAQGAGTRSLDALGGFLRRWPLVATTLCIGAAAMASLPGLNMFTSEWLLVRALLFGTVALRGVARAAALGGVVAIALVGGLGVLCFVRLVGVGLAGSPRTTTAEAAPRPGWAMALPLLLFAGSCLIVGAMPSRTAALLTGAVTLIAPAADAQTPEGVLRPLAMMLPLIVGGLALLVTLRRTVRRAPAPPSTTWACGYSAPTVSMQYTGMSFSNPMTRMLQPLLRNETEDRALVGLYVPLFAWIARAGRRLRGSHHARVTGSLLYIGATVLAVLALLFLPGARR